MDNNKVIKVYTTSNGAELNISAPSARQLISATNNRAQYFAEQAQKYRDEAKIHRDNAKFYADQNSNVTFEHIENFRNVLEEKIATKQDCGDYALKDEIPINVSELQNDAEYVMKTELEFVVNNLELPSQEGCSGKVLATDGENEFWTGINSFQLFDIKNTDYTLSYEESKGLALQGTYVYKNPLAGSYYGYPDFYNKCVEEFNNATNTETVNGITIKVHSNGHKFYNINNKNAIDDLYNSTGVAWFYGVDTENERIFLPRDERKTHGELIDSYNGNSSWYRIYSDGWCEQGGITSGTVEDNFQLVTFLKPFANLNYTITYELDGTDDYYPSYIGSKNRTTRTVEIVSRSANVVQKHPLHWRACGYINLNYAQKTTKLYICVGNTTNYEGVTDVVNQGMDLLQQLNEGIETRVKLDGSNAKFPYIIETYIDNSSWYRIWAIDSTGKRWCEQGGTNYRTSTTNTITFLKPFANTNYTITAAHMYQENTTLKEQTYSVVVGNKLTTGFTYYSSGVSYNLSWIASGYIT